MFVDKLTNQYPYVFLKSLIESENVREKIEERDYSEEDLRELLYMQLVFDLVPNPTQAEFWRMINKNLENSIGAFEKDFTVRKVIKMYYKDHFEFADIGNFFGKDFIEYELKNFIPEKHKIIEFLKDRGHKMKDSTDYGKMLFLCSLSKVQNNFLENRKDVVNYIFELKEGKENG